MERPRKKSWLAELFLILIWLVILRNILQIDVWNAPRPKLVQVQNTPSIQLIPMLQAMSRLPSTASTIYKMDIYPHEILLYGKTFKANDLTLWLRYFHQIHSILKVEVRQWDLIKSEQWRFIIALVY